MIFDNEIANTLYIPLTMKALEHRKPDGLFRDQQASDLVEQLAIPLPEQSIAQRGMQLGTAVRVKTLDDRLENFIRRHPGALLVTIGCGLDNRLARLNITSTPGLNIDLAEVLQLRTRYIQEVSSQVVNKDFSIFEDKWIGWIKQHYPATPVCFIAEGVFMYFTESQVQQIIRSVSANFPRSEFWFDINSTAANDVMNQREDFKQLNVTFKGGLDDPEALQTEHFRLIESVAIMDCFPQIWGDIPQYAPEVFKQGSRINGYRII